jgi:hypothetical protein
MLRSVVLILVLAVFDTRYDLNFRRAVAPQLVCDDHARDIPQSFLKLAKELLGRLLISPTLDKNIQHVTILIYCAPEVMETSVDFEENFVEGSRVAGSRRFASQAVGIGLTELEAPFSDSLIAERHPAHC